MKIGGISNQLSFGRLKICVDKDLLKFPPIKKEFLQLKKVFKDNGYSRKKNVNVILDYDSYQRKFVGIVESKKQGIPNNPDYKKIISSKKKDVKEFGEWLDTWDYNYSPKGLKEWERIKQKAKEAVNKRLHIVSIWRDSL